MVPDRPTQNRVSWKGLLFLIISLLCLYFQSRKEDELEMKRWQDRQQAQQEAEEQISREAEKARRTVDEALRQRLKNVHAHEE